MKIRNGEIEVIHNWLLNELSLSGKKSRMRMKFISILEKNLEECRKYHTELLKEHCNLDENGNPKTVQADGQMKYDVVDLEEFNKAYNELILEEFVIEENEQNREMLFILKLAIDDCEIEFKGQDAIKYERIASLFDNIYINETRE